MFRRWASALALIATGCVSTSPRFSQELATSFAHQPMRTLVTKDVEVLYPEAHRDAALRLAARSAECLRAYRDHEVTKRPRDRALLFLTTANYNNAYVTGQFSGEPLHSVNPLFVTDELFHWYGLGATEGGDVSCHEMLHFAHFEQVEGVWRWLNAAVGPVVPPQALIDRWFTEGVAQYYEGRLFRPVGRPSSPLYRGAFESVVDAKAGHLDASELSLLDRELYPYSGAYLTSLPFVEWLVDTWGEDKLWQVMDVQGRSLWSPFGVTLRFGGVYGQNVGALVEQWSRGLQRTRAHRGRPADQQVIRDELGQMARLAVHAPTGTIALLTSGNDEGPRLRLLERDGTVRIERALVRVTTDRDWILAGPASMSGLSFTADGRWLYLVNDDVVALGDTKAQLWRIDVATGETVKVWQELGTGLGGAVRPDGSAYTWVQVGPGQVRFVDVDLASGKQSTLLELPAGISGGALAWSPDGQRLVFSRLDGNGWNLVLREPSGQLRPLTVDGAFNYGARFADAAHVVFTRTVAGRSQVHRLDVDTGRLEVLTDAPWTLVDPAPAGEDVFFVNRDGVGWTLDRAPARARTVLREFTGQPLFAQADPAPEPVQFGLTASPGVTTTPPPIEPVPPTDAPIATDALPAPQPAVEAPPRHEPPALEIEQDTPYSAWDGLFVPQLRMPGGGLSVDGAGNVSSAWSLSLLGRDRLGLHTWAISGSLLWPSKANDVEVSYLNLQLAPWALQAVGDRSQGSTDTLWTTSLSASRDVYTTPVSLGLTGIVRELVATPGVTLPGPQLQRFIGPRFGVSYSAGESTAYGGAQRAFAASLSAAGYAKAIGSSTDFVDLSASLTAALPKVLFSRSSFVLNLSGRALPGAPSDLLKVGGDQSAALWVSPSSGDPDPAGTPGTMTYPVSTRVAVRGYEDMAVRTNMAATGSARWRYTFVIDRGWASTLWIFPSAFVRQVDVAAFGNATLVPINNGSWMRAAGAQLSLKLAFLGAVPVSFTYQFAWRFDLGLAPLHVVNLTFD